MPKPNMEHVDRVMEAVQSSRQAALSSVAASWCRSALNYGLDPAHHHRQELLGMSEMARLRDANGELLQAANPVLDALYHNVGATGCCVILTDAQGIVLESRTSAGDEAVFDELNLRSGADWSEAAEGTNGIGTCIAEQRPLVIHRNEHFASRNIGVSCMDAPVYDPEGQIVAALDVSSGRRDHGEAMAHLVSALVRDAARQIERDYFCQHYSHARIVYAPVQAGKGSALLAVDKDDLVIGATRAARLHYRLGQGDMTTPRPLADVMGLGTASTFEDSERAILRQALARCNGNVTAAARSLGIGRATFYRRMERVGLDPSN